jgi:hypothetical protein
MSKNGSMRVSKREWYDRWGGFANPMCWRRQLRTGAWCYFVRVP